MKVAVVPNALVLVVQIVKRVVLGIARLNVLHLPKVEDVEVVKVYVEEVVAVVKVVQVAHRVLVLA